MLKRSTERGSRHMLYIVNDITKQVYWNQAFTISSLEDASYWMASHGCREVRRKQVGNNRYIFVKERAQ